MEGTWRGGRRGGGAEGRGGLEKQKIKMSNMAAKRPFLAFLFFVFRVESCPSEAAVSHPPVGLDSSIHILHY